MTEHNVVEILNQFDLGAELERRITHREGPPSSLEAHAQEVHLQGGDDSMIHIAGRLHFEMKVASDGVSMQSTGDPPFTLHVPCDGGEPRIDGATLDLAGFAPIDLAKDRAEFEELLERALLEVAPRENESWATALVRHDGGAAIGRLSNRSSYGISTQGLRERLATLRDGLLQLRERAFAEDSELAWDESEGWTGSALDLLCHHLGETWRPSLEDHVAVVERSAEVFRSGDESARGGLFDDPSAYNAITKALRALEEASEPAADRAVKGLREATAPHQKEGAGGMLHDLASDWLRGR